MRTPRKLKKKIPKGFYCYEILGRLNDGLGFHIKCCPYYKHEDRSCNLIHDDILDQCKDCGINYGKFKNI